MAGYDVIQFVADQLKAAAPNAEWNASGQDRARELAGMLVREGVTDLTGLQLVKVVVKEQEFPWQPPIYSDHLAFKYRGKQIGFMGEPDKAEHLELFDGTAIAWSPKGHGNVNYHVKPGPQGGFIIVPQWGSSSDAASIRQLVKIAATFVVGFAMPIAGISAASTIGAAVVGPTLAASYPALASTIGNIALGAAFSGGDIEGAVKGAVIGSLAGSAGALVGQGVTSVSNIDMLGKFAAAATQAYISGGDVKKAVAFSALQNGGAVVDAINAAETVEPSSMNDFDYAIATGDPDVFISDSPDIFVADNFPVSLPADNFGWGAADSWTMADLDIPTVDIVTPDGTSVLTLDSWNSSPVPNLQQSGLIELNDVPHALAPIQASDNFNWGNVTNVVNTVGAGLLKGLQLVQSFAQAKAQRTIVTQARAVLPTGQVASGLDSGVVQTQDAAGNVSVTRPPVGVAQATVSGNYIVNNGNGTYDLVTPAGQRRTYQYGDNTGGGLMDTLSNIPAAVWIGVAGLALTAFK